MGMSLSTVHIYYSAKTYSSQSVAYVTLSERFGIGRGTSRVTDEKQL